MNKLDLFMQQLTDGLAGIPKALADDVILYYGEFIDDARKAGRSDDLILAGFGSVSQVVHSALDEASIAAAQSNPSPIRLLRTSRRILGRGAVRAARSSSLVLLSLFPLLLAIACYIAALAFALAVPVVIAVLLYSILRYPDLAPGDILGQSGLIVFLTGICLGLFWAFWQSADGLSRTTLGIYRKIARPSRSAEHTVPPAARTGRKKRRSQILAIILAAFLLIGMVLASYSGLFRFYFALWNSSRLADVQTIEDQLPGDISKISITTLNTHVTVIQSDQASVSYSYERQPYYLLRLERDTDRLALLEAANGRLPLISLLAAHAGTTRLVVAVPADGPVPDLEIKSSGGDIDVQIPCQSVNISTYSGDITLHDPDGQYDGVIDSRNGQVIIIED